MLGKPFNNDIINSGIQLVLVESHQENVDTPLCVNKQPTTRTRKLEKEKEKFDVKKCVGEKLWMYHVESLNKEMGDANKSLIEE